MNYSTSRFRLNLIRRPFGTRVCAAALISAACVGSDARAQSSLGPLVSREELLQAADRAETAAVSGELGRRAEHAALAASIRERLRDGDLQAGDRVVITIISDAVHRDTVVVRSERTLELQGMIEVPLAGVLRSELRDRVSSEVRKYIKAQEIDVTPLMRVGVLGAVIRPGYFAFASDIPITDAIMGAGGPAGGADVGKSVVRRRNQEIRSAVETSKAIADGLTLDQFGLSPGDELVVGQRRDFGPSVVLGMTGALASLLTLFVAVSRH
jgi:hypothetical protein